MINSDHLHSYAQLLSNHQGKFDELKEDSIHRELYSVERLEQFAETLAGQLQISEKSRKGRSLRSELKKNGPQLEVAYQTLALAIGQKQSVSPASEWFVDNYHLIETQFREIKQNLPDDYYYGLPQLAEGGLKGYPRVYAIALAFIAHTDSHLDPAALQRFLMSYQKIAPLRIGELWALVITLRIVLVQHLTVRAQRLVSARASREKANLLADRLLSYAVRSDVREADIHNFLNRELGEADNLKRAFIVQLIQRLRDQDANVWPAFEWIEKKLDNHGTSSDKVTQMELHLQASAQVAIGNIIGSMRLITGLDWREFFEKINLVDPILALDPAGAYLKMDFQTRDHYRHVIESISKRSPLSETEVAQKAIALGSHVGYHLIGPGKDDFKKICHFRPHWRKRLQKIFLFHPTWFYLGLLSLFTLCLLIPVLFYYSQSATQSIPLILFTLIAIFPASELALSFLNHYMTYFIRPQTLPRMELKEGIPSNALTMVVIPTLFSKEAVVKELVDRLEIHALANQDPNLFFALLGDFTDSPTENNPQDEKLITVAMEGIHALNARYSSHAEPRFHLFHRRRKWNEAESAWIGWERKRGKLLEFNRLLRGATDTTYIVATAEKELCSQIKYIITLDSDTQLPRDSAKKLVGTILHPLNEPHVDHKLKRVTRGYGILQPRISITASSAAETRFSRISSGNIGIDPYTTAVSDVYQDLFHEGSFTGKGLYVVDAFEESMENRVPENAVLSHDLFEGSYARSALVTDVELFDDYPGDYETFSKRAHRWIRGDWQIFAWIFPLVRNAQGKWVRNNLSVISRWKIFDNLRRSLVPPATFLWLILAWTLLPGSPYLWTLFILLLYLFPVYSTVATGQWMRRGNVSWQGHILGGWQETKIKIAQILVTITFLAQQAWTQSDAIIRVIYRMNISRKRLLEWTSFAQVSSSRKKEFEWREILRAAPMLAIFVGVLVFYLRPEALPTALPFLLLWFANPWIKIWLQKSPTSLDIPLSSDELSEFRFFSRTTWHFFETFVSEKGNWLAPDNFQEDPLPVVAHRTSPTNIGLQLLAGASAYDLGYVGRVELIELYEKIFGSLNKLPKMHGHFFNWYDTTSLSALHPRYISTVDSGNLAGHLLVAKQFLIEIGKSERQLSQLQQGLEDSLLCLLNALKEKKSLSTSTGAVSVGLIQEIINSALIKVQETKLSSSSEWQQLLYELNPKLIDAQDLMKALTHESQGASDLLIEAKVWIDTIRSQLLAHARDFTQLPQEISLRLKNLIAECEDIFQNMDFNFLFDKERKLFVIGYNVEDERLDNSYYDLLASESRLASFVAIAKGDVPQEHWFRLGRRMTPVKGGRALIAWTATMFEYLMPVLVMRRYKDTLLEQTYRAIVQRQIEYGIEKNVPWGVSEAGFNARDLQMNYQYGPFGIPGLGLKRGLSDELVVSPYSTMLAALISPRESLLNLNKLKKLGAFSRYGFYESIDYTAERIPGKQKHIILRSYMAHHQGMSLVAMGNLIFNHAMQERFHTEPLVQSAELLLQERIPRAVHLSQPRVEEIKSSGFLHSATDFHPRLYSDVNLSLPRTQLLSNGTYSVMLTSTGSGYSRCGALSVSRWREDATRDHWGQYFYIRNQTSDSYWSATHQPVVNSSPESFGSTFSEDKVEFWRRDSGCLTRCEIIVSPEDNVELRKISITNECKSTQEIEVTSFMEAVLAKASDDNAHPAFSNLFVQTEFISSEGALIGTRRSRSNKERPPWVFHVISSETKAAGPIQYETDRARFIGRGRSVANPIVIHENRPLSNTVGSVLDPVFSLRQSYIIAPGECVSITFATGLVSTRQEALELVDKYRDDHIFQRESEITWTQAQVQLRHLNISNGKAHIYQRLAGRVLYLDSSLRPSSEVLAQNNRAQTHLWAYGISGDLPIILTQISDEKDMSMIRELLHAHEYLRLKGLVIDLVILNERAPSYLQSLQDELQRQIRMSGSQALLDRPGGVFLRRTDLMPKEDVTLLRTVARVILSAEKGSLEEQLKHRKPRSEMPLPFVIKGVPVKHETAEPLVPELKFFNGLGGFTQDSKEYVITLKDGQWTPAPWINVIANSLDFGFTVSESGSGYTWSVNSRENRITPWSNDPVSDPPGEVIYLRDEDSGEFWSPTPLPVRSVEPYLIRHGQGYSTFEHNSHGYEQRLEMFVVMDAEVKISRLKIKNVSPSTRNLSVTSFVEWVMGFQRGASAPYVMAEYDEQSKAILARNPYNNEFSTRVAFANISESEHSYTADRREFLGRNGSPSSPAALKRAHLSGTSGAGLDPCAAFQTKFVIAPGEEKTILIILGEADSADSARTLIKKFTEINEAELAYQNVLSHWEKTLTTIEITTPDESMNTLVNRWLLYQTLSCRIWARSAFYQSGGAFGFRDQLQDVMATIYSHPEITRAQILTAAARQFREGDVQHWWHPPTGRGVRTHFSDDLIWLPFVVSYYVSVTGDYSVLEERVPFIEAPILEIGQDDSYTHPQVSQEIESILEHCARTLDRSLKVGRNGLPLMGAGDWNDGMSRVGHEGKGESVWVAWFLYTTLNKFIPLCERYQETDRALKYRNHLNHLKNAVEENAWDGNWYRRAYFDDGTPLGSAMNEECRIDSISQSWAALSGAADKTRTMRAMAAVDEFLIRRGDGLIQLFTPPFDKTNLDPGYIKGYVPGVRENGGQYTHAAIWTMMAYAELGNGDQATELYALLNPVNHAATRAGMHKYKVEPYVVAADIYGSAPHVGRGGWTWYTGSASWMYRAALESILGFEVSGDKFRVNPKVSSSWQSYKITYRRGETIYHIDLNRQAHPARYQINEWIPFSNDGKVHEIRISF